jgi:hypothetical protein
MLLLSFLRANEPFPQPRDLVAADLLCRSTSSGIEVRRQDQEAARRDLWQFFHHPSEPLQFEAGSSRTQQSDATQLTVLLEKIQQISERLFPGPVSFEHTFDPEEPTCEYTVFDVTAEGNYADYRDRIFQWHDEVERIVPRGSGDFRLVVGSNYDR